MPNQYSAVLLSIGMALTAWGASPELPRERVDTALPVQTGATLRAADDCADLQAKIDAARPGDTVVIPRGTTCTGNYVLRNKGAGSAWIVIQSSGPLPMAGLRVNPGQAAQMAKIVTRNGDPAIRTEAGAHHYRLIGLEITAAPTTMVSELISFGDGSQAQKTIEAAPSDLTIDRCYIHGNAQQEIKRGVGLNSARTAVIDSYFSEIHVTGQDSQALCGWNGPGPFRIQNNFLSASTENVMFGGAAGYLPNIVPSDIEIIGNYFFKPLSWKPGDPSFAGKTWSIKNLLEFKNARRVLVEGNVFENAWNGFAALFTVRTQGFMSWNAVEDITFTGNLLRHIAGGMNLSAFDDDGTGITQRILFRNNIFHNVDRALGGTGTPFQILHGPPDIKIDHNTAFQSGCAVVAGYSQPGVRFEYTNNMGKGDICSADGRGVGTSALEYYFPAAVVVRNVFAGAKESQYPPGNFFPARADMIEFANFAEGDYRLTGGGYKGAGTDGLDLGADVDAVMSAAARALAGSPRPVRPLVREPARSTR